jgi:hypothetical protein
LQQLSLTVLSKTWKQFKTPVRTKKGCPLGSQQHKGSARIPGISHDGIAFLQWTILHTDLLSVHAKSHRPATE